MPPSLIERANEILKILEDKHTEDGGKKGKKKIKETLSKMKAPEVQLSIFDVHTQTFEEIRKTLEAVDINRLTPVEALLKLQEIKAMVK